MQAHIVFCGAGGTSRVSEILDTGLSFVLVEGDEQKSAMAVQETHGTFPATCVTDIRHA